MKKLTVLTGVLAALVLTTMANAQGGLERLYVLDCGVNQAKEQSRWSPGVNEGKPIEFSDNCYLIRHAKGLLLWDTGIADAVAAMPNGMVVANGPSRSAAPRRWPLSSPRSGSSLPTSPTSRSPIRTAIMSATSGCSRPPPS